MTPIKFSTNELEVILDNSKLYNTTYGKEGCTANLSSANLSSADLSSAFLISANLSSADLSFADLRKANLSSANLSSANLSFADLISANLSFANLSSADLSSADLSFADLRKANLISANLSFADLRKANLSFADLNNARLNNCIGNGKEIKSIILHPYTIVWNSYNDLVCIGCKTKSLKEWKEFSIENYTMNAAEINIWNKYASIIFSLIELG